MPSECYRFIIQGISTGEQCQNVLHFLGDNNNDATPIAMAKELLNKWASSFKTGWLTWQSEAYAIRWISARRVIPSTGNTWFAEFPGGTEHGTRAYPQCPLQVSPIVKLFAGLSAGTQGRIFLPTPAEPDLVNNVIDADYHNGILDHIEAMQSFSGSAHNWNLAVFSRKNGTAEAVSTASISEIIGMQGRRRKPL